MISYIGRYFYLLFYVYELFLNANFHILMTNNMHNIIDQKKNSNLYIVSNGVGFITVHVIAALCQWQR